MQILNIYIAFWSIYSALEKVRVICTTNYVLHRVALEPESTCTIRTPKLGACKQQKKYFYLK